MLAEGADEGLASFTNSSPAPGKSSHIISLTDFKRKCFVKKLSHVAKHSKKNEPKVFRSPVLQNLNGRSVLDIFSNMISLGRCSKMQNGDQNRIYPSP